MARRRQGQGDTGRLAAATTTRSDPTIGATRPRATGRCKGAVYWTDENPTKQGFNAKGAVAERRRSAGDDHRPDRPRRGARSPVRPGQRGTRRSTKPYHDRLRDGDASKQAFVLADHVYRDARHGQARGRGHVPPARGRLGPRDLRRDRPTLFLALRDVDGPRGASDLSFDDAGEVRARAATRSTSTDDDTRSADRVRRAAPALAAARAAGHYALQAGRPAAPSSARRPIEVGQRALMSALSLAASMELRGLPAATSWSTAVNELHCRSGRERRARRGSTSRARDSAGSGCCGCSSTRRSRRSLLGQPVPAPPADTLVRFPIVLALDVPFLVVRGYVLGGKAQPVSAPHRPAARARAAARAGRCSPPRDPEAVHAAFVAELARGLRRRRARRRRAARGPAAHQRGLGTLDERCAPRRRRGLL